MTTRTYTQSTPNEYPIVTPKETLLRRVLYGNVAFSAVSASLFLLASRPVAEFLGIAEANILGLFDGVGLITVLGISIASFGLDVLYIATRKPINTTFASMIAIADFAWVAISWLLLVSGALAFSDMGNWAVLIVSDIVLVFGILEVVGIRRINH